MFNFQQHTRQLLFDDECKKIKNEHIRLTDLRKHNNLKMSTNYARRVDAFILSALESPVPVDEYRPPNYLPRDILKNSSLACLHPKPFRMKYNTASQRIEDIANKTKDCDGVPFQNASLHKFRDLASSCETKPIRLNASCSALRVYENFKKNRTNQIAIYDNQKLQKIFRSTCPLNKNNRNLKSFQRGLAPSLHRKTYFNSLRTLTNDESSGKQNIGYRKRDIEAIQQKNSHDFHEKDPKKVSKENTQEISNRKKNAIEALVKCGLMKQSAY